MNTIAYIRKHGYNGLTELGIKITKHKTLPLRVFNYETFAEKTHPVVLECRGLVMDEDFNVLCKPMTRFFNYGEVECDRDFNQAVAYEKLDGTMINVWWNPYIKDWSISTRNSFGDAQTAWGNTFDSLVRPLVVGKLAPFVTKLYTHVFEFTSPENRVLTKYSDYRVTYLTSIGVYSGNESNVLYNKFPVPRVYRFTNKEEIDLALAELPELEEGYVVKWPDNYRLKVKNPAYLAKARTSGVYYRNSGNGAMSQRRAMEVYFNGEMDEYLAYFPEDAKLFELCSYWPKLADDIQDYCESISHLDKKSYALSGKHRYSGAAFAYLSGVRVNEYLNRLSTQSKIALLENYTGETLKGD